MWQSHDRMFSELNDQNKNARPGRTEYSRKSLEASLTKTELNMFQHDLQMMNVKMYRFERLRMFLERVHVEVVFFRDEDDRERLIEDGFPHTMGNTIFLPKNGYFERNRKNRVSLLIHECTHIYQRMAPFDVNKLLIEEFGLIVVGFTMDLRADFRANPDINRLTYASGAMYNVMTLEPGASRLSDASLHTYPVEPVRNRDANQNGRPAGLSASSVYQTLLDHFQKTHEAQIEHPFEVLACVCAAYIYGSYRPESKIITGKLETWLGIIDE